METSESAVPSEELAALNKDDLGRTGPVKAVTFEDVLSKMGGVGWFQYTQCAWYAAPAVLLAFMAFGFVFIGYTPSHVCAKVNETELLSRYGLPDDSTAQVIYGPCDITVSSNRSGVRTDIASMSCPNGRHFPDGSHMTLVSEWDLVCEKKGRAELAQFLYTLGNIIGGIIVPSAADFFGRKPVLCISSIVNMAIEFSITFAPNMYFVCSALFLDGIAYAGSGPLVIVYGMEIFITKHRQVYGVFMCQLWLCATLVVGIVGYILKDFGWRYFQATGALTGILSLLMPFFVYESPRWLAVSGRVTEALSILEKGSKLNGQDFSQVKKTFEDYMATILPSDQQRKCTDPIAGIQIFYNKRHAASASGKSKKSTSSKQTLWSMITKKDTLVLLLVVWYMWTSCNLVYYGIYMSSSNLAGNRFLNFCILSLVEFPANFLVYFLMNRCGRLHIIRVFLALAGCSLLSSLLLRQFWDDSRHSGIASLVLFIFGKFAITCTFNVIYIITPEIFPTVLRSAGNGSCKSVPKVGSMLAPYSRPLYTVAKWAPGLIFTSLCFIALPLTLLLPEMKNRILPTKLRDIEKDGRKQFNDRNINTDGTTCVDSVTDTLSV